MRKLFVDLDGTLADFDRRYFEVSGKPSPPRSQHSDEWRAVIKVPSFFSLMKPMPDMWRLWDFVKHFNPTILSGAPSSVPDATAQKRAWVDRLLGMHVPLITCEAKDKWMYKENAGDILIDDWLRYKDNWEEAGGVWITHVSAGESVRLVSLALLS